MSGPIEVAMPKALADEWPSLLEGHGFSVEAGPSLEELLREGRRRHPHISVPELAKDDFKWYHCVDCIDKSITIRVIGGFDAEFDKYVIELRTQRSTWWCRRRRASMIAKILSILCANGGSTYYPYECSLKAE